MEPKSPKSGTSPKSPTSPTKAARKQQEKEEEMVYVDRKAIYKQNLKKIKRFLSTIPEFRKQEECHEIAKLLEVFPALFSFLRLDRMSSSWSSSRIEKNSLKCADTWSWSHMNPRLLFSSRVIMVISSILSWRGASTFTLTFLQKTITSINW
jgi:hypothetical protein